MGSRSSLNEDFVRVKTLMGLEPFEVRFFIRQKFTKSNLALKWLISNFLKIFKSLFMMILTFKLEIFFVGQKSYWNTSRLKNFYTIFFCQLRTRGHGGLQIKICFRTIKDLQIFLFGNNGIYLSQDFYGYKMLWYLFRATFGYELKLLKICWKLWTK